MLIGLLLEELNFQTCFSLALRVKPLVLFFSQHLEGSKRANCGVEIAHSLKIHNEF